MALPLGDYPCHHLDHGPDTVEVHREDYEIALDAKEKLKIATGTIRKLRIAYAKSQRHLWERISEFTDSWNDNTTWHIDGTVAILDGRTRTTVCHTADQWFSIWNRVVYKLEAK